MKYFNIDIIIQSEKNIENEHIISIQVGQKNHIGLAFISMINVLLIIQLLYIESLMIFYILMI